MPSSAKKSDRHSFPSPPVTGDKNRPPCNPDLSSNSAVIRARGISKEYVLGTAETRNQNFREMIGSVITAPMRRLRELRGLAEYQQRHVALKNVSFEIQKGQVTGIIGRNGAGKSTLLKILSRITAPDAGRVEIRGRVSSLLEVGTGFHPELTGRENIYLNGAILGMTRAEIDERFNEIVAFAETDQFLDTPVKRYSSGMYMRLAFAVAAHLESEILLVDEVLAVGDAGFQKRCLRKMSSVASDGRTVLFVTHNLAVVQNLCDHAMLLDSGQIVNTGDPSRIVLEYMERVREKDDQSGRIAWNHENAAPGGEEVRLKEICLKNEEGKITSSYSLDDPIFISVKYVLREDIRGMRVALKLLSSDGITIFTSTDEFTRNEITRRGVYETICQIPPKLLNVGTYFVRLAVGCPGIKVLVRGQEFLQFSTHNLGSEMTAREISGPGVIAPVLEWQVRQLEQSD